MLCTVRGLWPLDSTQPAGHEPPLQRHHPTSETCLSGRIHLVLPTRLPRDHRKATETKAHRSPRVTSHEAAWVPLPRYRFPQIHSTVIYRPAACPPGSRDTTIKPGRCWEEKEAQATTAVTSAWVEVPPDSPKQRRARAGQLPADRAVSLRTNSHGESCTRKTYCTEGRLPSLYKLNLYPH